MRRTELRRAWVLLLPLCAALVHPGVAHASDAERIRRQLLVQPGATCLTAEKLAVEVERLLDGTEIAADFVFVVEGSATDASSARLHVARHGKTVAQRVFEPGPARCSHLHAAVGLAIALAIKAAQEDERYRTRAWSLSLSGLWTYEVLPRFAPGAELSVRRTFGEHVLLRAGALGVAGFDATLQQQSGTFDSILIAARLDGCARAKLASSVHAGGCLGMLGGALYADSDDAMSASSSVVPWFALSAAADFEFELSERWSLAAGLSATFLLHRVEIGLVDASGEPAESRVLTRLGFAAGLGPVYYF
jgi:hypothetical protein